MCREINMQQYSTYNTWNKKNWHCVKTHHTKRCVLATVWEVLTVLDMAQIPLGSSRLDLFDVSSESSRACRAVLFQHGGRRTSSSARLYKFCRIYALTYPNPICSVKWNKLNKYSNKLVNNLHVITLYKLHNKLSCVSSSSCRTCWAVLFDKLDTGKMHGLSTSNVSSRDVTSQVEFWLISVVSDEKFSLTCRSIPADAAASGSAVRWRHISESSDQRVFEGSPPSGATGLWWSDVSKKEVQSVVHTVSVQQTGQCAVHPRASQTTWCILQL